MNSIYATVYQKLTKEIKLILTSAFAPGSLPNRVDFQFSSINRPAQTLPTVNFPFDKTRRKNR